MNTQFTNVAAERTVQSGGPRVQHPWTTSINQNNERNQLSYCVWYSFPPFSLLSCARHITHTGQFVWRLEVASTWKVKLMTTTDNMLQCTLIQICIFTYILNVKRNVTCKSDVTGKYVRLSAWLPLPHPYMHHRYFVNAAKVVYRLYVKWYCCTSSDMVAPHM